MNEISDHTQNSDKQMFVFVDTNLLFQCNDIRCLPYDQIVGTTERIIICFDHTVVSEIDKKKNDSNKRKSEIARNYNSLFGMIFNSSNKEYNPPENSKLTLKLMPYYPKRELKEFETGLDFEVNDDLIIAGVIKFVKDNPNARVFFITNDTGVLLKSQDLGIVVRKTPDDWLRKPANDERDKEILKLKDEIKQLSKDVPIISVERLDGSDYSNKGDSLEVKHYQPLDSTQIDDLVSYVQTLRPMKTDYTDEIEKARDSQEQIDMARSILQIKPIYELPSEKEISNYQKIRYPKWAYTIRKWLEQIQQELHLNNCEVNIGLQLSNTGHSFANRLMVKLDVNPSWLFVPDKSITGNKGSITPPPNCPEAPKGSIVERTSPFMIHPAKVLNPYIDTIIKPRIDPLLYSLPNIAFNSLKDGFVEIDAPTDYCSSRSFKCNEFRHITDNKLFDFVLMPRMESVPKDLVVTYSITAANLREAVTNKVVYRVDATPVDTFKVCHDILSEKFSG